MTSETQTNDESRTPAPARDSRAVLTQIDEVGAYITTLARLAERNLAIYGETLETEVYGRPELLEALKRFVLARPYARIRILLASSALDGAHPLVRMAARLPSLIEIRGVEPEDYDASAFVIADERAVVYRMHCTRWDGIAELQNPLIARLYLDKFEQAWSKGAPLAKQSTHPAILPP